MLIERSIPVLVADTQAAAAIIIADMIHGLGFSHVDMAGDGAAALDLLHQSGPSLVIANLHMEPVGGLQLLRTIRMDERLRRSPFIMTMATLSPAEASSIKQAGGDSFILQPFTPEALETKIQAVLMKKGSVQENVERAFRDALSSSVGRRVKRRWS